MKKDRKVDREEHVREFTVSKLPAIKKPRKTKVKFKNIDPDHLEDLDEEFYK